MVNLEILLEKAKVHLKNSEDNKVWCETEELIALLGAGAQPIVLNHEQSRGSYHHEIIYDKVRFVNATSNRVLKLNIYLN